MDLLSNRVWSLFLSRIDGEIKGKSLRALGHQWRRESEHKYVFRRSERMEEAEDRCGGEGEV